MESNILHELAAFDIRAPIQFTISFEDSDETNDSVAVKTEQVIDDDNIDCQDVNSLPDIELEPNKEIKEEPIHCCETIKEQPKKVTEETSEKYEKTIELNAENKIKENVLKETTTLQTESIQNSKTISSELRKRKQTTLQIYKNKTAKNKSTLENISNHLTSYNNEKETASGTISNTNSTQQDPDTSQVNPPNIPSTASIPSTQESDKHGISCFIIKCLAFLSENMRLVMEEFVYHKRYNTPYLNFKKQKLKYFQSSFSTVQKVLLPERQNANFIRFFLLQTYEHACKKSPLVKGCVQDYEALLIELLAWATEEEKRISQVAGKQESTMHPTPAGSRIRQEIVSEHTRNQLEANASDATAKTDKICIFSSGSSGNEITITVDPRITQQLSNVNKTYNESAPVIQTPCDLNLGLQQPQISLHSQPATQANNKNKHLQELLQQPPLQRLTTQCLPNIQRMDFQSQIHPESYKSDKENLRNNNILTKQIKPRLPQVQKQIKFPNNYTMPEPQLHLPQSQSSQQMLLQSQQSTRVLPVYGQSVLGALTCGQSTSSLLPPPYNQSTPIASPWHHVHSQLGNSQHLQSKYRQQFGHPQHNMLPQYGQVQSEIQQQQNIQRQYGQLQMEQSIPILPQRVPQHVSPQIEQSQCLQPEYVQQPFQVGEWRQGLNDLYYNQGQTQSQTHRSAPRSASTDSGFISPLNFNATSASSDQTVPPIPAETESPTLLITHVTSLNPKVAFMDEGSCVVCNKTTKKVCMGCMKIYYCTYECQLQDWDSHGPNCNNIRIMAQLVNQNAP